MLGQDLAYDRVPYFYTDQYDLGMEYAGYVEPGGYDQVVFRGDPGSGEFLAFMPATTRPSNFLDTSTASRTGDGGATTTNSAL